MGAGAGVAIVAPPPTGGVPALIVGPESGTGTGAGAAPSVVPLMDGGPPI